MKLIFIFCNYYKRFNQKFNNLIIVRTFQKLLDWLDLEVGYCISNKKIIDLLKSIKPNYELK